MFLMQDILEEKVGSHVDSSLLRIIHAWTAVDFFFYSANFCFREHKVYLLRLWNLFLNKSNFLHVSVHAVWSCGTKLRCSRLEALCRHCLRADTDSFWR